MLYDRLGNRKYLTAQERRAFLAKANTQLSEVRTFCLMLAYTGARISEVLALTPERIDFGEGIVIIESIKKRRKGIFRAIPLPPNFLQTVDAVHRVKSAQTDQEVARKRIWRWCRGTGWRKVKRVLELARVPHHLAMPKALRHSFGVCATGSGVPLNIVQRWMGHSRIATTAIYADAMGDEERAFAKRMWGSFGPP
jgi:integrase